MHDRVDTGGSPRDVLRIDEVAAHNLHIEPRKVGFQARREVVEGDGFMSVGQQSAHEVAADEAGSTRHENLHNLPSMRFVDGANRSPTS